MKWALIVIGVLVALILVVVGIGYALPVGHVATRSAELRAAPAEVWEAITDVGGYPKWRTNVDSVEFLAPVGGRQSWREVGANGTISYVMANAEPPRRMVTRIADRNLPFGGEWDYSLVPAGDGTRITITERGEVYNPVFRFVSRFIMGHTSTLDTYLRALGTRFGQTVEPASD